MAVYSVMSGYLMGSHVPLSVGGVTVSMVAFQAVDPGSIPGRRSFVEFTLNVIRHIGMGPTGLQ